MHRISIQQTHVEILVYISGIVELNYIDQYGAKDRWGCQCSHDK